MTWSGRLLPFRGVSLAGVAAAVTLAAPVPAVAPSLTLSSTTGPTGGGNPVTASATAAVFAAGSKPVVQFQYYGTSATACRATATEVTQIAAAGTTTTAGVLTVDPAAVRQLSPSKVVFTVPSAAYPGNVDGVVSTVNTTGLALADGQSSSKWNVCLYDSDSTTTSTLLAASTYTIYARPAILDIRPASSPAAGGQSITVLGTGFLSTANVTAASIAGSPLTDIKVSANGNSFTATTTAHAPGAGFILTVKTLGGTVTSDDPDNNGQPPDADDATPDAPIPFTFSNGITVSPNNAPAATQVDLDVTGAGFSSLSFNDADAGSPTDSMAHVFLVRDAYDPVTNRGVAECGTVVVISDTELICSLDLTRTALDPTTSAPVADPTQLVPEGTYTLTTVTTGSTSVDVATAGPSIVSTGSTFTVGPY